MEVDRTERHNLADQHPERVRQMAADYRAWAKMAGVESWPMPQTQPALRNGLSPYGEASPKYLLHDRP